MDLPHSTDNEDRDGELVDFRLRLVGGGVAGQFVLGSQPVQEDHKGDLPPDRPLASGHW